MSNSCSRWRQKLDEPASELSSPSPDDPDGEDGAEEVAGAIVAPRQPRTRERSRVQGRALTRRQCDGTISSATPEIRFITGPTLTTSTNFRAV